MPFKASLLTLSFLMSLFLRLTAQPCACDSVFRQLSSEVEKDYAGFKLAGSGNNKKPYEQMKARLIKKASAAKKEMCLTILNEYINFFNDSHFGIIKKGNKTYPFIRDSVENRIPVLYRTRLSGYWLNDRDGLLVKITGNNAILAGIVQQDRQGYSKPGDTLFRIFYDGGKNFNLYYFYHKYYYQCVYRAAMNETGLLLDNGVTFKKIQGAAFPTEKKYNENQELNFMELDQQTTYLGIPSFYPSEISRVDSVLRQYDTLIQSRKNLVIDLRNNGGGTIETSFGLVKYFYTQPFKYPEAFNMASDSAIAGLKTALLDSAELSPELNKYFRYMLNKMEASPGKLVSDTSELMVKDRVLKYPENVIILSNKKTASAAELFILAARQSKKVKIFGTNSSGTVDFGWPISYSLCQGYYRVSIPSQIAAHTFTKRYDKLGIAPDVRVPATVSNWPDFVRNYFK